jgi:hypothetical protein
VDGAAALRIGIEPARRAYRRRHHYGHVQNRCAKCNFRRKSRELLYRTYLT